VNFDKNDDKFLPLVIMGFVVSFLLGGFAFFLAEKNKPMNADKILNDVKEQFKAEGPIEGSWIEMTKVPWKKYAYDTEVYYGGVSRMEKGEVVHYEFVADAYTGSLMDIYSV